MTKVFEISGKTADISKVIPLRLKDLRELKKRGADMMKLARDGVDIDVISIIITYVVQRANPEISTDDIDELTIEQIGEIFTVVSGTEGEVDIPT